MPEERFEQDQSEDETEDVEAHKKAVAASDEPGSDDESDDVEAHARRAQHKSV